MAKINWNRVVWGGVVAAIIWSALWFPVLLLLRDDIRSSLDAFGTSLQLTGGLLAYGSVLVLVFGMLAVWLYAAIRPRYGPGPKTAAVAGLAVWLITVLVDAAWFSLGILSLRLIAVVKTTDLVATILATLAGAWMYQEAPLEMPGAAP